MNKMQIFKVFTSFANIKAYANHVRKKQPVPRRLKHKNMKLHSLKEYGSHTYYRYKMCTLHKCTILVTVLTEAYFIIYTFLDNFCLLHIWQTLKSVRFFYRANATLCKTLNTWQGNSICPSVCLSQWRPLLKLYNTGTPVNVQHSPLTAERLAGMTEGRHLPSARELWTEDHCPGRLRAAEECVHA